MHTYIMHIYTYTHTYIYIYTYKMVISHPRHTECSNLTEAILG